jgi:short-subunit dehydrogenase
MSVALVTGASSGIGKAFAEELARRQYDLIIIARSLAELTALKQQLESQHQVKVFVITQDLSLPSAGQAILAQVQQQNLTVDLLINNAGFGDYGKFGDRPLDKQLEMIQVNITALVELTHLFLPQMRARKKGQIINVSSIAGYQSMPYLSVYAATKAFILSFSEALWAEYQDDGIHILALCPGPTETAFPTVAEFPHLDLKQNQSWNSLNQAEDVVKEALSALDQKNKANLVTGGLANNIIVNLSRFFPRELITKMLKQQFKAN